MLVRLTFDFKVLAEDEPESSQTVLWETAEDRIQASLLKGSWILAVVLQMAVPDSLR